MPFPVPRVFRSGLMLCVLPWALHGAFTATDRQPTPEELAGLPVVTDAQAERLLRDVGVPDGFEAQIFAAPPAVNYPVFVAAAPDGTLYVSSDGNGSLDRKPHLGRVLRVRDRDGDGRGDEVRAFVPDVDSPRGLVWDQDRLYLLHPPDISVFFDRDGDGVAEERRTLVRGIAFTFADRPADHSSNGLELGVDGWLYAAIGDFGFLEATGTDGRRLQLRGGGVVRVRPDGTGLEVFAEGTRNILEVAVSPLLDGFARDNTNDGGGWDVRLHHFSGMTRHGYPRLFKNFPDEILPPLADYGGGSGCGAAWIDEPGIPARWNGAPFTADWGRERVFRHGLSPAGATFTAGQEEFLRLPRVTDLDVDARGAIYAASWKGASFTWVGPDVGFLVRVVPSGAGRVEVPDFGRLPASELVAGLGAAGHRVRLASQRELIRRHREVALLAPEIQAAIRARVDDGDTPLVSRVAALFAWSQVAGLAARSDLVRWAGEAMIAPWALRALGEVSWPGDGGAASGIARSALASTDARTRKEAAVALARQGDAGRDGGALIALLEDPDPVVAHTAVQALVRLGARSVCLAAVDSEDASAARRAGALQVLQSLAEVPVVEALVERLGSERDPLRRRGLLTALCRLHFVEGVWKGDSWGTRPDTRGPWYQPEAWEGTPKVSAALRAAFDAADASEAAYLGRELARHRIPVGDALARLIERAGSDGDLLPALAAQLSESDDIPSAAVPLLARVATGDAFADAARAQAVIALTRTADADAWRAVLGGLPAVRRTRTENNLAEKARGAVFGSTKLDQVGAVLAEVGALGDGERSELADGLLLRLAGRKVGAPEARDAAARALDAGWGDARRRVQILRAAVAVRDASRAGQIVGALDDPDPAVAVAAREAVRALRIDPERLRAEAGAAKVGDLEADDVLKRVALARGDAVRGEQLFTAVGCPGCHTVRADEPLKGPYLGNIATIYRRGQLAEAILLPNRTLAQGFATHHFELRDGAELDGFVVREAADSVVVRTVTAEERALPVADIVRRSREERSLMPEGLVADLSVGDFASLLDYLIGLAPTAP